MRIACKIDMLRLAAYMAVQVPTRAVECSPAWVNASIYTFGGASPYCQRGSPTAPWCSKPDSGPRDIFQLLNTASVLNNSDMTFMYTSYCTHHSPLTVCASLTRLQISQHPTLLLLPRDSTGSDCCLIGFAGVVNLLTIVIVCPYIGSRRL